MKCTGCWRSSGRDKDRHQRHERYVSSEVASPDWIETDRIRFAVELKKKKLRFLANFCMIGGQNHYAATPLLT